MSLKIGIMMYRYLGTFVSLHGPIVKSILHSVNSTFLTAEGGTTTHTGDDCVRLDATVVIRRRVANMVAMG